MNTTLAGMPLGRTTHHDLAPALALAARLRLAPRSSLVTALDGAWWPHSRDLAVELPPLMAALDELWGRITRVTVNPTHWPVVPPKVDVAGRIVHIGRFVEQDPDKLILLSFTVGRWDLLVIPPETAPASAARLLAAAALPGSMLSAGTLMANEAVIGRGVREAQRREADWEVTWETEGGACMSPFGEPLGDPHASPRVRRPGLPVMPVEAIPLGTAAGMAAAGGSGRTS
ncbi:DUF5994 family protein [Streptomyces sp. NPDC054952]